MSNEGDNSNAESVPMEDAEDTIPDVPPSQQPDHPKKSNDGTTAKPPPPPSEKSVPMQTDQKVVVESFIPSDFAQMALFDVAHLCVMVLQLLRALFTSTAEKYRIPLQGAITVRRLRAAIQCSLDFQNQNKPIHTSLGFILKDDLEMPESVQLVEDSSVLSAEEGDKVLLCAVLLGNVGKSLSLKDVDAARSLAMNGGFVVRHSQQVFPLMEFDMKHIKEKKEQVLKLQKHVLDTLNGFFGELRPPMVPAPGKLPVTAKTQLDRVQIWDVACDKTDVRCANHFGNRRFAAVVCVFMAKNFNLLELEVRRKVAKSIIHIIQEGVPAGRFLGKTKRQTWKQLNLDLAIRWVSSILRTAAENAEAKRKRDAVDGLASLKVSS